MPSQRSVVNLGSEESYIAYCCSKFSKVVELTSLPAGISLMSETRFTKHSPAL